MPLVCGYAAGVLNLGIITLGGSSAGLNKL